MPNFKGTRCGLGFKRECVCCYESFEIYSNRQIRCGECARNSVSLPKELAIKMGKYKYVSKK
jgi:hypothetical protein